MPLYEYKCDGCGDVFELIQRFSDEPLTVHDACGAPVRRLISAPALQFKGTGWYVTDYAKSGAAAPGSGGNTAPKSGTESKGSPETNVSKSSETKSEASKPAPAATTSEK